MPLDIDCNRLNFDGTIGTLIGEPNKGLEAMFTFMNTARIGTAIQGVAHAELSFQGALPYAQERRSMRALSGKKEPDQMFNSVQEGDQAKYKKYDDELGFYSPIRKGFLTEMGLEAANLGIQLFGGPASGRLRTLKLNSQWAFASPEPVQDLPACG